MEYESYATRSFPVYFFSFFFFIKYSFSIQTPHGHWIKQHISDIVPSALWVYSWLYSLISKMHHPLTLFTRNPAYFIMEI